MKGRGLGPKGKFSSKIISQTGEIAVLYLSKSLHMEYNVHLSLFNTKYYANK